MDISVADKGVFAFGGFRLDSQRRVLMHAADQVKLTPKAFDTLLYFVTNAGRVIEKDELLSAVWGGRIVEEGNLTQTIFSIRKALQCEPGADRWIVTAPGRGYRFTADVLRETGGKWLPDAQSMSAGPGAAAPPIAQTPAPRARARPLAAACAIALAALIAGSWYAWRRPAAVPAAASAFAPPPHSVAVLAFANLSGDPAQEYFSDGLADELINTLSRIDTLRVAARTSAFSFKGSHATIAGIARELNVGAVLEGSVQREGNALRVNVQLINAATGFPFWSRTYDRDLGKVLASQEDIARAVAASLQVNLLGADLPRLVAGGTSNPQALDAYLRGASHLRAEDGTAALADFETAISLDPGYALARAGRSKALRDIVNAEDDGNAARMSRLEDESIAEAERAVALAPQLGAAHATLGAALEEGRFDFQRALQESARARDLAPGDVAANTSYADLQSHLGHMNEAIAAATFGTALDPLSPRKFMDLASVLVFARRYPEALQAARHAAELRGHMSTYDAYEIGEIQLLMNQPEAALATCAGTAWPLLHCQALAFGKLGRHQEAEGALTKLRAALGDAGAMQYAVIYAQWGQPEQALQWLQTAYTLHDPGLIELQVLPFLDPIRGDAAFKDIQRRMNFPP